MTRPLWIRLLGIDGGSSLDDEEWTRASKSPILSWAEHGASLAKLFPEAAEYADRDLPGLFAGSLGDPVMYYLRVNCGWEQKTIRRQVDRKRRSGKPVTDKRSRSSVKTIARVEDVRTPPWLTALRCDQHRMLTRPLRVARWWPHGAAFTHVEIVTGVQVTIHVREPHWCVNTERVGAIKVCDKCWPKDARELAPGQITVYDDP